MSQAPKKRVYFGRELGKGGYKVVFAGSENDNQTDLAVPAKYTLNATAITKDEQKEIIFEHETPDKTVISCVFPKDEEDYMSIYNELYIQKFFSSKDLAPKIYNFIVEIKDTSQTTYYNDAFPIYNNNDNHRIFILQDRCDTDMEKHITRNVPHQHRNSNDIYRTDAFFEETHNEVKDLIDKLVNKLGVLLLDFKPSNICKTNNNSIALDLDKKFVIFFQKIIEAKAKIRPDEKDLYKDIYEHSVKKAKVFMFVQYYITIRYFLRTHNPYYGLLLSREGINAEAIFNMFLFFDHQESLFFPSTIKNGVINRHHTPRTMLEHYSYFLDEIKITIPSHIPTTDTVKWKKSYYSQLTKFICEHLDIPFISSMASSASSASNESSASTLPTVPNALTLPTIPNALTLPTAQSAQTSSLRDVNSDTFDRNIRARIDSPHPGGGGYAPPGGGGYAPPPPPGGYAPHPGGGGYAGGKRKKTKNKKNKKNKKTIFNKK